MRKLMSYTLALVVLVPTFSSASLAEDKQAKVTLERALKAVGGLRRLGTLKRPMLWMDRGTYYGEGNGIPFIAQYAAKWPNWYRREIEGFGVFTASGKKAWESRNTQAAQELAGARLAERLKQVRMAWASYLFPLAEKAYTLTTIDGIEVNGRPTVGIKASHADGGDFKFYFDKETYLLAKTECMVVSPQHGTDPVLREVFYSGRSSYGPSKYKIKLAGKLFIEGQTIDRKVAATLDPAHFEAPK